MTEHNMNALAAEFKTLKEEISRKEKRAEEIGRIFKQAGSMVTEDFVITVTDQERVGLVGLAKVEEALGREALEKNSLISTVSYKVVKVADKPTED